MKFSNAEINDGLTIYNRLPKTTCSGNVVIRSIYGLKGVAYAKSLNGIFTLRLFHTDKHFGNPYTSIPRISQKNKGLIPTDSIQESVKMFITWVLHGEDDRCIWIREVLSTNELIGKPLIYYKELNEPSHANALDYLINNWNSLNL